MLLSSTNNSEKRAEANKYAKRAMVLGYAEATVSNGYYTGKVAPSIGVAVAPMIGYWLIHMFPWDGYATGSASGHDRYTAYLLSIARSVFLTHTSIHRTVDLDADMLTIKCLIEDALNQLQEKLNEPNHKAGPFDPAAGKAVE